MTLSIIARCPVSGKFGVAAVTEMPAVGKLLSYAEPGIGAAATQAKLNPYLGIDGMRLISQGMSAGDALRQLIENDPRAADRQFALLDGDGHAASWTGDRCPPYAGAREHDGFSVQGNRLAGPDVLDSMVTVYHETANEDFDERLIRTLEAAVAAGGDREGERSATLYIVDTEEYPLWDIRVDEHDNPLKELRRLHDVFKEDILPQILTMPTRGNPAGSDDEPVA